MTRARTELGRKGERLAAQYLKRLGYRILETNHRNGFGEIDIVAHDGGIVCFVEVRTRTTASCGHPFESISRPKQKKLIRAAQGYLMRTCAPDTDARFDVVAVTPDGKGGHTLELLKNAFEAA